MAADTMVCPHCHTPNPAMANRCVKCDSEFGFDLDGPTLVGGAPPPKSPANASPIGDLDGPTLVGSPPPAKSPSAPKSPTNASPIDDFDGPTLGGLGGTPPAPKSGPTPPPLDDLDGATLATSASPNRPGSTSGAAGWSMPAQQVVIPAGAQMQLQPGTLLGTRYEIVQLLGQGGMGAVYKATDRELERLVALKVIRPELAVHADILQRFKQELILARKITHRNVIRIFDLGEADGVKFITMEFIEGQDLKSLVTEKGRLPYEESMPIVEQVCMALECAHSEGVVHRDLKPQNIMVDKQGRVVVMDFGIARSMEAGGMTQTGMLVGTPEYMSPEQVMGEHVDTRSDLFTLGVILYELLVGQMPYKAETVQAAMFKRTRENPRPPIEVDPNVPKFLNDIAAKCLQIDPKLRYQTAAEIRADLESWRGGSTKGLATPAIRVTLPVMSWKLTAIATAVVLLLAIGGWFARGKLFGKSGASAPAAPTMSLAILPFHNASSDTKLDWLGSSMSEMLSTDVGESSRVRMVSPNRIGQVLRDLKISADTSVDLPTVQRVADFSSADTVVWGQYAEFGDQIRIDATVQDLKRGRAQSLKETAAGEKDILPAIDRLAAQIRSHLDLSSSVVKELQAQSFKPSSVSLTALRSYDAGLQLARQGKDLEAVTQYQAATQDDPEFALAFSRLAQAYSDLGQDDQAEQASRKAVDLSDKLPAPEKYLIVANHDRILKDYPKAIAAYQNLANASPENTDVLFDLAHLYEDSGDYDKARDDYAKVLQLDPKRVDGLLAMGRAEIESGDTQSGLDYLTRAQAMAIQLGDDEERAQILQATGVAYQVLKRYDEALRSLNDSLDLKRKLGMKKGIADSLEMIASTEALMGKPDLALKNYNDALNMRRDIGDKAGTGDVLNDLAQFYDDHGQYDQSLKLFKEALQVEIDVGNENQQGLALNNIGNTYLLKGDYENARTYFEQALTIREKLKFPMDVADTLHNLGETASKMGQYDQALDHYLKALDLRRSVGDKRGAAIESSSMGILFGYQGRFGAALSSDDEALKNFRDTKEQGFFLIEILNADGNALAEVGRADDAEKILNESLTDAKAAKNQSEIAATQGFLGDNFFYRGDYKSAAPLYEEAQATAAHAGDPTLVLLTKFNEAKLAVKEGKFAAAAASLRTLSDDANSLGLKYLAVECSVYRAEALIGVKDYAHAQQELQSALTKSDKLSLRALLAQAHYLMGRSLELSGKSKEAANEYGQARKIADEIQKESKSDAIAKRSDLAPIFAHAAA